MGFRGKTLLPGAPVVGKTEASGAGNAPVTATLELSLASHQNITMTVADKQRQLVADLNLIENPQERLAAVVDRARRHPPLPDADKSAAHRVTGCVSAVWITGRREAGRLRLRCDADSPLVRGLVALLCELYDDATPADIAATEPQLYEETGLADLLSPTRLNGLRGVRAHIRRLAEQGAIA